MDIENADDHYLHYSFILLFFLMPAKKVAKLNWIPTKLEMIQSSFLYTKVSLITNQLTRKDTRLRGELVMVRCGGR